MTIHLVRLVIIYGLNCIMGNLAWKYFYNRDDPLPFAIYGALAFGTLVGAILAETMATP